MSPPRVLVLLVVVVVVVLVLVPGVLGTSPAPSTLAPSLQPTLAPTFSPTSPTTSAPTLLPTLQPTFTPTTRGPTPATTGPTPGITVAPTLPTFAPTRTPTTPTNAVTNAPTSPTKFPTPAVTSCTSDLDKDGTPDCDDLCPNDFNKVVPGLCACGISNTLVNMNGDLRCADGKEPNYAGNYVNSYAQGLALSASAVAVFVLGNVVLHE